MITFSANRTIELQHPSGSVAYLTMRRPTLADMLASKMAGRDEVTQSVHLLATLCDVGPEQITELSLPDLAQLNETFVGLCKFEPIEAYRAGEPIALARPIVIAGVEVSRLCLRAPSRRDTKRIRRGRKNSLAAQEIALFALLSGIMEADMGKLDWSDYRRLQDALNCLAA